MTHTDNTSPATDQDITHINKVPHEDPGAYPFPFGQYAGQRLDTVPPGLRWWATDAKRSHSSWVSTVYDNRYRC